VKNPSYSGITTEFWNALDAICSRDEWTLWGTPNCGKGQPQQVMGTGHGASPARFRGIHFRGFPLLCPCQQTIRKTSPGGRANLAVSLLLEKGERMARFSNVDSLNSTMEIAFFSNLEEEFH
jgi:hypothetical protein